ncbi:MAG: hypothetical protein L6Q94_19355 [Calditrichia bacterium]|nr:hypothetical protein [Calditrichia bacterium]
MKDKSKGFKFWFKPQRILPLLTIVGAGLVLVFSMLEVIKLSVADSIIIALLALIAIDSIVERLSILENIEGKINNTFGGKSLRSRTELWDFEKHSAHASEICILAISAISMSGRFAHIFENKVRSGCKIKIILLNPQSESLKSLELTNRDQAAVHDIKASLAAFEPLIKIKNRNGKCEIRLSDAFLPFSLVALNLSRDSGEMVVEYHSYKSPFGEQPHVFLTTKDNAHWYKFYRDQFEKAWNDSVLWKPTSDHEA